MKMPSDDKTTLSLQQTKLAESKALQATRSDMVEQRNDLQRQLDNADAIIKELGRQLDEKQLEIAALQVQDLEKNKKT